MKLKKTLALILGAALSVASLTGCSQTTMNYADELAKTEKWGATSSEVSGKVSINAQGINEDINFTSTGYATGDKAYAKVDFTTTDTTLNLKIPSIEMYIDNGVSYINKSYYEGLYSNNGLEVPKKLKELNADYIAVDSGIDVAAMKSLTSEPETMNTLIKSIFGDSDIDLPYIQNGREYTMNLNSNDAVDLGVKGIKAAADNLENINSTFKLNLTADNIASFKTFVKDQAFNNGIAAVKEAVAGSTISSKEVFTDDKYTMDLGLNLVVKDFGNISVDMTGSSSKSEVKEIAMPTNFVKLTEEQLQSIISEGNEEQITSQTAYSKESLNLKHIIAKTAA